METPNTRSKNDISHDLQGQLNHIWSILNDSGISKSNIEALQQQIPYHPSHENQQSSNANDIDEKQTLNNTISVLRTIQSYTHCYPYMDTFTLIQNVHQAWELLSELYDTEKSIARRKVILLKADNKTDPDILNAAVSILDQSVESCTKCNAGLYEVRALVSVHQKSNMKSS